MGFQLSSCILLLRACMYRPCHLHACVQSAPFFRHSWINTRYNRCPSFLTLSYVRQCTSTFESQLIVQMDAADTVCPSSGEQTQSFSEKDQSTKWQQQMKQNNDSGTRSLSKRAMKRIARAQKHKEYKRQKKNESPKDDVGYSFDDLRQSSYYFENGVRKVYPYTYIFATHAKGRWVGRRIQDVLEREFGYDQPDELMKSFDRGLICVNGKPAAADYILQDCDYISHKTHRHENPVTAAPIEIIENNDELVVINKPPSIPCHPCGRYRFNSVVFILGKEMGLINLRNIYRLDRLTSGVLILCKSPARTKMLMDQVANRLVQKEYVCRVVGKFPDGPVTVEQPLKALSNKLRLQVVSPTGKPSHTTFTRLSYNGKSSVVRCIPYTGRTHQIRVHLQYLGHPILNDAFYNSRAWGPNRGKNGVYEVPFDKVCEQILAEHHEKLWTGGENPLYEAKLKEMKQTYVDNKSCTDTAEVSHDERNSFLTSTDSESCGKVSSQPESRCSDKVTDTPHSTRTHVSVGAASQNCSGHPVITDSVRDSSQLGDDSRFPGFDMSKWSVDLTCELCKTKSVDPQQKHLVMFLHAIKYQGPGWVYETPLPFWATDTWSREEDFIHEDTDILSGDL